MKFKKQIEVMILVIMCSFSAGWYVAAEENEGEEIQKEYEIRIEEPDGENGRSEEHTSELQSQR